MCCATFFQSCEGICAVYRSIARKHTHGTGFVTELWFVLVHCITSELHPKEELLLFMTMYLVISEDAKWFRKTLFLL